MLFPSVNSQKRWLSFLLLTVVSINIYFDFQFPQDPQNKAKWLDDFFGKTLVPVQWLSVKGHEAFSDGKLAWKAIWDARDENSRLKSELAQYSLKIQQLESDQLELARLREALGFKGRTSLGLIPARITARDPSLFVRTLEIDHGAEAGVALGMPVVAPAGAVGKIIRVSDDSATILLINDVNSRLDAVVERSRSRVIVAGSAEGNLNLRFLGRRFDLQQGDELVTSGFGGFFPEGFKVGIIVGLAQDPHFVLDQAELEPAVNFDALEEVFVVKTISRWP